MNIYCDSLVSKLQQLRILDFKAVNFMIVLEREQFSAGKVYLAVHEVL
jgi:hypothetical protein